MDNPAGDQRPPYGVLDRGNVRGFRIIEIGELENPDPEDVHGVWIVEPDESFCAKA